MFDIVIMQNSGMVQNVDTLDWLKFAKLGNVFLRNKFWNEPECTFFY